jgi:phosphoglycolate phosphatase-like HAD superfamily hydrolase
VKRTIGLTLEESIRTLTGSACDVADLKEIVITYRRLHQEEAAGRPRLFPGVRDVLELASRAGIQRVLARILA